MILRDKWIAVKLVEEVKSGIVLPDGISSPKITDETAVFSVLGIGRQVEDVRVGDEVVLIAAMGSLARFTYRGQKQMVTMEGDVIAIMNRTEAAQKPVNERGEPCRKSS